MRNLTLHERINIREILSGHGIPAKTLIKISTAKMAIFYWGLCLGYHPVTRLMQLENLYFNILLSRKFL